MTPVADAVMFVLLGAGSLLLRRATSGRVTPVHLVGFLTAVGCFALLLHYGPCIGERPWSLRLGSACKRLEFGAAGRPARSNWCVRTLPLLAGLIVVSAPEFAAAPHSGGSERRRRMVAHRWRRAGSTFCSSCSTRFGPGA